MNDVRPAWVTVRAWGESAGSWDHREGHDEHYPPSHLLRVPQRDEHGPTRMLQLDAPWEHDLSLLTGHHTPVGLMSLRPGRVDRLVYARHVASDPEASLDQTLLSRRTLLDLFNVQYLVIDAARFEDHFGSPETNDSLIQGQRLGRFTLVENRTHLPRSFFVTHASYVQSAEQARARITSASFEPRREIVLETNGGPTPPNLGEPRFQPATVTAYENERVQVEVAAPREGWVVLLDRWAPGWSARMDGQSVPVLRADYLFRAVRVPAGRHHLVFAYDNALFRWGLRASAVGLTVVLAAAVSLLRARRR
jgi:hypothetical protein